MPESYSQSHCSKTIEIVPSKSEVWIASPVDTDKSTLFFGYISVSLRQHLTWYFGLFAGRSVNVTVGYLTHFAKKRLGSILPRPVKAAAELSVNRQLKTRGVPVQRPIDAQCLGAVFPFSYHLIIVIYWIWSSFLVRTWHHNFWLKTDI